MAKKGLLLLVIVCAAEALVFTQAAQNPHDEIFQLAARYSARVSLLLVIAILLWTGTRGLRHIYGTDQRREWFVALVGGLSLNHLIHFYFLAMNFQARGLYLLEIKNLPGAVAYLVIVIAPFYLWHKTELTPKLHRTILIASVPVLFVFTGTYVKRLGQDLNLPIAKALLVGNLLLLLVLIGLNVYRIFRMKQPD